MILDRANLRSHYEDGTFQGEERWTNVLELRGLAQEYGELVPEVALEAFLADVSLASDVDRMDESGEGVTLITLHMVKGLEFPVVFLAGMEEGLFPHSRSLDDPEQMEEERRLCYVGMTRARERLYLTLAYRRHLYGNFSANLPSRFLSDLPRDVVRHPAELTAPLPRGAAAPRAVPQPREVPIEPVVQRFSAGDRVLHNIFGRGVVMKSTLTRSDEELVIRFDSAGLKILSGTLAPLRKV
jgi:DNA helicase-2/ATP-dependent DNA helicase PcrA